MTCPRLTSNGYLLYYLYFIIYASREFVRVSDAQCSVSGLQCLRNFSQSFIRQVRSGPAGGDSRGKDRRERPPARQRGSRAAADSDYQL